MKISSVFIGLVWLILLKSGIATASDYHSPRTDALGGAGHAAPLLNDSIYLNPSYEAFLPSYSLSLNYETFSGPAFAIGQTLQNYYGRIYNISLQDGRSDLFHAGVGFTQRPDGSFVNVGAAHSVIERVGAGVGAKFFFNNVNHSSGHDAVLSVSGIATDWLQGSWVVDNLLETTDTVNRGMYREFVLGTKVSVMKIVLLYLDPHWIPNKPGSTWGYEVGAEYPLWSDVFLRAGGNNNSMQPSSAQYGNGWSIGLGYVGPRFSLDYSFVRTINPLASNGHNFGMTMYF